MRFKMECRRCGYRFGDHQANGMCPSGVVGRCLVVFDDKYEDPDFQCSLDENHAGEHQRPKRPSTATERIILLHAGEDMITETTADLAVFKYAVLSDCKKYRYALDRSWDKRKPTLHFVMLNPSTADAEIDDPTIRKCVGFAKRLGFGSIRVVNLFAWRATDPKDLVKAGKAGQDIVGDENDRYIMYAAENCDGTMKSATGTIVLAWGSHGDRHYKRVIAVEQLVRRYCKPMCLGRTSSGQPRHPLMLSYSATLEEYDVFTGFPGPTPPWTSTAA